LSILSKTTSISSLISILSLIPEILSSICSRWLEWLSTVSLFDLRTFYFQDFCLILFSKIFHIFIEFLFSILCSILYFIYLFL
jgi:hypothetical protein